MLRFFIAADNRRCRRRPQSNGGSLSVTVVFCGVGGIGDSLRHHMWDLALRDSRVRRGKFDGVILCLRSRRSSAFVLSPDIPPMMLFF